MSDKLTFSVLNDSLFEQAVNISKAHGYDILAKQVGELRESNKELSELLEEFISLTKDISNGFNFPILGKAQKLIKKAKILSL